MSQTELAWCAGFFDGEGNVAAQKNRVKYMRLSMNATQIDRVVLDRMQNTLGGSVTGPYKYRAADSPLWHWNLTSFEGVQYAICLMWNFLSPVKKAQATKALTDMKEYRK